jgi:hypothetical protein
MRNEIKCLHYISSRLFIGAINTIISLTNKCKEEMSFKEMET